jgi:hypothetical protein
MRRNWYLSSSGLLILIILLFSGGCTIDRQTPPRVRLTIDGRTIDGEPGSSTWRGRAVDRSLTVPARSTALTANAALRVVVEGSAPSELSLEVYHAEDAGSQRFDPISNTALDPGDPVWRADLPPGNYIVGVFCAWKGQGESMTFFLITVTS